MPFQLKPRMLFCDWHMPSVLPEVRIDYDAYFAGIRRTGAESLIFQVKTAHGAAFAPTDVGITHPAMHGDLFGEIVRRAKAAGLEFIAYYNVVLSWELSHRRPEWSQIGADGQRLRMFLYPCSCLSHEGFRAHVCAHMAEVTARYPIDGWFLDLQYFSPEGCFCPSCREGFAARFGYSLDPAASTVRAWHDLLTYQVDTREAFIHATQAASNAERTGLSWSWNGCGSPFALSDTLDAGADYLSTEAHPPDYLHADHATRYCEAFGKPFTLFMPESQGSWGDWTLTTAPTIQGLAAIALAQNGSLNINHVPYPCGHRGGQVPAAVWDTLAEAFDFVAARAALCQDSQPVPVVGVMHSAANARLLSARSRAGLGRHHAGTVYGNEHAACQLLMETHTPWQIVLESAPPEELCRYELIILPCLPYVSAALADRLRRYVHAGGRLLANYDISRCDAGGEGLNNFALADLLGVDLVAESPYSVAYLEALDSGFGPRVPDLPHVIKDAASGAMNPAHHALYCRLRPGARALARITDPVLESNFDTGHYVYHDHAPPGRLTDYPGLVLHPYGAGIVAYFPVPFLAGYGRKKCPFLKELFATLVGQFLGPWQRARIDAPRSIKASLRQDRAGWLLHLIHIQKGTDDMYLDAFERSGPVRVWLRPDWPVAAVADALTGMPLASEAHDGGLAFTVPGVRDHTLVRVGRRQPE